MVSFTQQSTIAITMGSHVGLQIVRLTPPSRMNAYNVAGSSWRVSDWILP
jgi:hypothetical protein